MEVQKRRGSGAPVWTAPAPVVIGRDSELESLRRIVDRWHTENRGATVLLAGEAGVGKTRLTLELTEMVRDRGRYVVSGGCTDGTAMPLRALTGVVSGALEVVADDPEHESPTFNVYRPVLARVSPAAGPVAAVNSTTPVLAEAVVALLRTAGAAVVVEDLHWADEETLSVVEYAVEQVDRTGLLLVVTSRDDEHSAALAGLRRLAARSDVTVVELRPLEANDAETMARALLGPTADQRPADELTSIVSRSSGLPLLVEGLVSDLLANRAGAPVGERVREVPQGYSDVVRRRLARLSPQARDVLYAAAVFGPDIQADLVASTLHEVGPHAASPGEADIEDALDDAVSVGLLVRRPMAVFFRHSLTAEAVLASCPAGRLRRLLLGAAEATLRVSGDEPRERREANLAAADFQLRAGAPVAAANLLAQASVDSLANGDITEAVRLLTRADSIVHDDSVRLLLLRALVAAGESGRAADLGRELLQKGLPRADEVEARVQLGRVLLPTDPGQARVQVTAARRLAGTRGALLARVDEVDALVTLESTDPDRLERAEALAVSASRRAEDAGLADVQCAALQILGRCRRMRVLAEGEQAFEMAFTLAESAGLPMQRVLALQELGTIDALRSLDGHRLDLARASAMSAGAVTIAASCDVNRTVLALFQGRYDEAERIALECEVIATAYQQPALAATARVWRATVNAYRGRRSQAEHLLAGRTTEDELDVHVTEWAMCRTMMALVDDDRSAALAAYARADEIARRRRPLMGEVVAGPRTILQLASGMPADAEPGDPEAFDVLWDRMHHGFAAAILAGRQHRPDAAFRNFQVAREAAAPYALHRPLYLRHVAEAALADGWGDPPAWLREAEATFVSLGLSSLTSATRGLLRRAGVVVGRSGELAEQRVPPAFRARGVTAREFEVLDLVSARLTNREISQRLHLSVRTVEKHVANLLTKLDARSRRELGALRTLMGDFHP